MEAEIKGPCNKRPRPAEETLRISLPIRRTNGQQKPRRKEDDVNRLLSVSKYSIVGLRSHARSYAFYRGAGSIM